MQKFIKPLAYIIFFLFISGKLFSQQTFPLENVRDESDKFISFKNAMIHLKDGEILENGILIIHDGRIENIGKDISIPKNSLLIDLKGKHIFPSFIDLYSNYGLDIPDNLRRQPGMYQHLSSKKGAYSWNEAIRPEINAVEYFSINPERAKEYRENGFGMVLSHNPDGIMRGTGVLINLDEKSSNLSVLKKAASSHFSFNKGNSKQDFPTSLMGSVSLIRQSIIDANWYKNQINLDKEGRNLSLIAINEQKDLPKIFEANDKWDIHRIQTISNEFGMNFIVKASGNEYQRMDLMKSSGMAFILPLNFPKKYKIQDADDERIINLRELKHWELAPSNPANFEKMGISFSLTSYGLGNKDFREMLNLAIESGLTRKTALRALSLEPAKFLGMDKEIGSLEKGKLASFFISDKDYFEKDSKILENWVQGEKYTVNYENLYPISEGKYVLKVGKETFPVLIDKKKDISEFKIINGKDTLDTKLNQENNLVQIDFEFKKDSKNFTNLSGIIQGNHWFGNGLDTNRKEFVWDLTFVSQLDSKNEIESDSSKNNPNTIGAVVYPFIGYGNQEIPKSKNFIVKNVTIWTNEKEGILKGMDILVENGKIKRVGKNIQQSGIQIIDGTGKHLSPGIIDEHSHIAIRGGVNECSQSITAEVRVQDAINPDDINIFRQLSGGVTSSHLLHGSCNTIGGQTQLIKMKWGASIDEMLFPDWDPFIKFALGENVKRSYSGRNDRFPNTRLGVEQVLMDAFTRAKEYEALPAGKRRDLELDALVEILNQERFITCHSYVQSEINAIMKVAEKFNFNVNTFTHILEGYKVADKMKAHGASGSTFADWWAYKMEVQDAIPQNAYLMAINGMDVAINSDDAEMARRLNQEASKSIAYTPMSEEEALKMVTLNPAKMLHVDNRVGSIKVGKDADLVLWSDNPLSIYAKAEKTWVDGILEFDRSDEAAKLNAMKMEKTRIIDKMVHNKTGNSNGDQEITVIIEDEDFCEENHPRGSTIWDSIN